LNQKKEIIFMRQKERIVYFVRVEYRWNDRKEKDISLDLIFNPYEGKGGRRKSDLVILLYFCMFPKKISN